MVATMQRVGLGVRSSLALARSTAARAPEDDAAPDGTDDVASPGGDGDVPGGGRERSMRPPAMLETFAIPALAALALACTTTVAPPTDDDLPSIGAGDDDSDDDDSGGGAPGDDEEPADGTDEGPLDDGPCPGLDAYPPITGFGGQAFSAPQDGNPQRRRYTYDGPGLARDETTGALDHLGISLWEGFGSLAGGPLGPGTYPIGDADGAATSCGICVHLFAGMLGESVGQRYIAVAGSLTIEAIDEQFVATLEDIELEGHAADGSPMPECTSLLERVELSAPLEVAPN